MGKQDDEVKENSSMSVLSLYVNNVSVDDLWSLNTLALLGPAKKQSKS